MAGKQFWEKWSLDSADTLRVKGLSKLIYVALFLRCVFAFYAEIQDGRQKWQENNFWEKVASRPCRYAVGPKFIEITLARSVSKTNAFLLLHRNSR